MTEAIQSQTPQVSEKQKLIALILMIPVIIGITGLWRLYLGRWVTGILMLVLSFCGPAIIIGSALFGKFTLDSIGIGAGMTILASLVLAIWTIVDFFLIVTGHIKDGKGLKVRKWVSNE